jgi:hypothetical protein
MVRYILYAFLLYVAYKFVFRFLIPVILTTRKLKKQFREMHSRMQGQTNDNQAQEPVQEPATKEHAGDYIDFEEVK